MKHFLFLLLASLSFAYGQVPELPNIPGVPQIPGLPNIPGFPELPELPDIDIPNIPDIDIPDLPNLPELPEIDVPELPDIDGLEPLAEHVPEVDTIGFLSYVEDLPEPGNGEGIYRQTPFVEVIHQDLLEECKDLGFDQENCPTFEWSLPFLPTEFVSEAEEGIADAWYRLETRTYYRTLLEVGGLSGLVACTAGLGAVDLFSYVKTGDLFFPADEFCDDFPPQLFPNCFWRCDVTLSQCPDTRPACKTCVQDAVARATEHAYATYYLDYYEDVLANSVAPIVAAGGLPWSTNPLLSDGSIIAPVLDVGNAPKIVEQVGTDLIPAGVQIDPRAATYFTSTAAQNRACATVLGLGSTFGLVKLPTEGLDPLSPGLSPLDELKRGLSDRESAGDTWKRTFTLLAKWDEEALYPKYKKATTPFGNLFTGDESLTGAGLPTQAACLGYSTFFQMFQKVETVVSAHRSAWRRTFCWIGTTPGITFEPLIPVPQVWVGPRWHTDWVTVPEGYAIPRVEGEPLDALRP